MNSFSLNSLSSTPINQLGGRAAGKKISGVIFAIIIGLLSLSIRLYSISEIQPHHDEAPSFGLGRDSPLEWEGSLNLFLSQLSQRAVVISEADTTPLDGVIAEIFRMLAGNNMVVARWFHAVLYSLGIGIISWLAWRIFSPRWVAAVSVGGLAGFSIISVIYGQFGEMYAIYFLAGTIQYVAYWRILRKDYSWLNYVIFAVIAYVCTLFEYLQVLVTAGFLLSSISEDAIVPRRTRLLRAFSMIVLYAILNIPALILFLTISDFSEGFRRYYSNYYPIGALDIDIPTSIIQFAGYYIIRIYDLFNYHLALVFNNRFYQPLAWNWVFLPFILLSIAAGVSLRHRRVGTPTGVITVLVSMLVVCVFANALFLVPLGGIRDTLFLAPIIWLAYGVVASQLTGSIKSKKMKGIISVFLIVMTIIPFILSMPGFYRDRISRIDWDRLESAIQKYCPDTLIMAQASYDPFMMLLQSRPEFVSGVIEKYSVNLTSFFELDDSRWGKYPLPVPGEKVLALDLYISADGSREGGAITHDHPTLKQLCGPSWMIDPIIESPGKHATAHYHQSVYYPRNSFYLYLLKRKNNNAEESVEKRGD